MKKSIINLIREYLELGVDAKKLELKVLEGNLFDKTSNRELTMLSAHNHENGIVWHNFHVKLRTAEYKADVSYLEAKTRTPKEERRYQFLKSISHFYAEIEIDGADLKN